MRKQTMQVVVMSVVLPAALTAGAEPLQVLNGAVNDVPAGEMLHEHLVDLARGQLAERAAEVVELASPEALRERQRYVRETIIASIGGLPDKTPLAPEVVGTIERDDYRIEKVIYQSRPDHHVTAALYLPTPRPAIGDPPYPAVLVPCGHSPIGKAAEAYQQACIGLVKHGFVVLCYDPISQGERRQVLDADGKPQLKASTTEHTVIGVQCLLLGTHVAQYRIADGIRSVDYLLTRPEVDPARIGVTGNSGGGTMTAYLVVADERFACAAPSCYITSFRRLFETIGPQDGEQNFTGAVASGIDHADFLEVFAPKPMLVCAATKDFFDIQGTWDTFREAKRFYAAFGHSERIDLVEANDGHGFSAPRRTAMLRWMRRWLQRHDDAVVEPVMTLAEPAELQCTPTGEVLHDLGGKSTFDFNREHEQRLLPKRAARFKDDGSASWLERVKTLTGINPPQAAPASREVGTSRLGDLTIQKVELRPESGIVLPALWCAPAGGTQAGRPVVYVDARGKSAGFLGNAEDTPGAVQALVAAGHPVLAVDVRGWGETDVKTLSYGELGRYAGKEWQHAFLGLHTGRSLLATRTEDVLSAVAHVSTRPGVEPGVAVIGVGAAGPIALHAAAFDPRIKEVIVDGGLVSWSAILHEPLAEAQLPSVVVGGLTHYDLPLLARHVASTRKLTLLNLTDARGKQLDFDAARQEFDRALPDEELPNQLTLNVADTTGGGPYVETLGSNGAR